jgi:16S rRNA (cytosine967-C5)-methyltransferase
MRRRFLLESDSTDMDARTQAAKVLANILSQKGSLATLMPEASKLTDPKDKALLQEICFGVCRWFPRLEKILQQLLQKPLRGKDADIHALLLLGLYQLIYLRVPDHAALSATVESAQRLKKVWAKKLINGVLRQFLRQRESVEQSLENDPSFCTAHPEWLLALLRQAWPDRLDDIVVNNNLPPPFTFRVNTQQCSREEYCQRLQERDIEATPTIFSPVGITLTSPVPVDQLPGFDNGFVSVQDEAPQLAAELLRCQPQHRVLDACCAPGGKTTHLLEQYPNLSLVALDISEQRLQRTRQNLQRLNLHADLIIGDANEPSCWWDKQLFDRILLDAPCSATGILRRQPDIKILRSADSLTKLVNTQQQLLNALWPLLKPGGELLYATCSVLPEENNRVIERFTQDQFDARHQIIDAAWGLPLNFGRQLFPQQRGHDGFYYARLLKN